MAALRPLGPGVLPALWRRSLPTIPIYFAYTARDYFGDSLSDGPAAGVYRVALKVECLRHFVFFGERHLRHVISEYMIH